MYAAYVRMSQAVGDPFVTFVCGDAYIDALAAAVEPTVWAAIENAARAKLGDWRNA